MNQGKLEVIKQEMARVNINILGISELKWTGIGEFNSDDQHIYYCGHPLEEMELPSWSTKKSEKIAVLGCSFKNNRMIRLFPRQTIQYHSNPSLYPNK